MQIVLYSFGNTKLFCHFRINPGLVQLKRLTLEDTPDELLQFVRELRREREREGDEGGEGGEGGKEERQEDEKEK